MLRDGRTFYAVLFRSSEDLLKAQALSRLFTEHSVDWDGPATTKRCQHGTFTAKHGYYLSDKQYSADPDFLDSGFDKKRKVFRYNFYVLRYEEGASKEQVYILASPFKRLAARIFRHLTTSEEIEYNYQRVKLAKLLAGVDALVGMSPRLSVPMVDFYVYGDGGSEDVKISGSDPMKSKVYRALNALTRARSTDDRISIAPCSVIIGLDFQSKDASTFEVFFRGILAFEWQKDLEHLPDLSLVLHTLMKQGLIEDTMVTPTWMIESRAKGLLGKIPEFDNA